jgi:hypothetical protein
MSTEAVQRAHHPFKKTKPREFLPLVDAMVVELSSLDNIVQSPVCTRRVAVILAMRGFKSVMELDGVSLEEALLWIDTGPCAAILRRAIEVTTINGRVRCKAVCAHEELIVAGKSQGPKTPSMSSMSFPPRTGP